MELQFYPVEKLKREILQIVDKRFNMEECSVFFFGSRITGEGTERSDIDVGIEGPTVIPYEIMAEIREDIEALPTLYKVDVVDFKSVSPAFREVACQHIERMT